MTPLPWYRRLGVWAIKWLLVRPAMWCGRRIVQAYRWMGGKTGGSDGSISR